MICEWYFLNCVTVKKSENEIQVVIMTCFYKAYDDEKMIFTAVNARYTSISPSV